MSSGKKVKKLDAEWRAQLSAESYWATREKGTEKPFENAYHDLKTMGICHYLCCHTAIFDSQHKFDSGSGWPSFFQPIDPDVIGEHDDCSIFLMPRTEVTCDVGDSHLGHVFNDGPTPTGLRQRINSASLQLQKRTKSKVLRQGRLSAIRGRQL